jgi:hypothetical protein
MMPIFTNHARPALVVRTDDFPFLKDLPFIQFRPGLILLSIFDAEI